MSYCLLWDSRTTTCWTAFEADDIIAKLVEQNKDKRMPLVIYSTDSDLYQLLGNNVYMINARMASDYGRLKPFTAASMHEK